MDNTIAMGGAAGAAGAAGAQDAASSASSDGIHRQQMPLSFLKCGESARVIKVRGTDEVHRHLENLGFTPDAEVRIVNEIAGNVIVEVMGSQVALGKEAASKIITG